MLYGGSAKTRSTDCAGDFAISATQSQINTPRDSMALELTRGARADAPRRDTTMTQDSDSGDAAGDARPTTVGRALSRPKVKIGLIRYPVWRVQKSASLLRRVGDADF